MLAKNVILRRLRCLPCFARWIKSLLLFLCVFLIYENAVFYAQTLGNYDNFKIMIIADPQLVWKEFNNYILDKIAIWDSDKYMSLSYWYACKNVRPDLVVFLGDLLDRGSLVNDVDYKIYFKRFNAVFSKHGKEKHIYLDGDNDVTEQRESTKIANSHRFNYYFEDNRSHNIYANIKIEKLMILDFQRIFDEPNIITTTNEKSLELAILCSHMTILSLNELYVNKIMNMYKPNLILSGDDHQSKILRRELDLKNSGIYVQKFEHNKAFHFEISNNATSLYELSLPSISYRMGFKNTGIGVLELKQKQDSQSYYAKYRIIWLPYRYWQLYSYLLIFICITFYSFYM